MEAKVKKFKQKIESLVLDKKQALRKELSKSIESLETIYFEKFGNVDVYTGEVKNKIFFTYNNHYWANSGYWMEANELKHPHKMFEDRGYIKGLATDLDGFLKIKMAFLKLNNIPDRDNNVFDIYYPSFRKSQHSEEYKAQCNKIKEDALKVLSEEYEGVTDALDGYCRNKFGFALSKCIRNI